MKTSAETPKRFESADTWRMLSCRFSVEHGGYDALSANLRQIGLLQSVLLHQEYEHIDGTGIRNRVALRFVRVDEIADAFREYGQRGRFVRTPGVEDLVEHGDQALMVLFAPWSGQGGSKVLPMRDCPRRDLLCGCAHFSHLFHFSSSYSE